jgi:hypothetical protein
MFLARRLGQGAQCNLLEVNATRLFPTWPSWVNETAQTMAFAIMTCLGEPRAAQADALKGP